MFNPVIAEVTRGGIVESRHRGVIAVSLPSGELVVSHGDADGAIFPRSAAKPFQALAFIAGGGDLVAALTADEIAITCASHNGEPEHVATVRGLLAKAGFDETALECGPAWPRHPPSARAHAAAGGKADAIHHTCSGKHAGMLALARTLGVDPRGYIRADHPVQKRIAEVIATLCGVDIAHAPCGTDGCSVPTWAMACGSLARGYARIATGEGLDEDLAAGARRIREAMSASPFMVAGTDRFCTRLMRRSGGAAFVKTGAEGVMCAGLPGRGLGLAVKCDDGADRAAEVAIAHLLARFGAIESDDPAVSADLTRPIVNSNGRRTGEIRASAEFAEAHSGASPVMIA